MDQLKMDLDNSAMPLDQRLEDAGIDAQEFKTLYASQQKVSQRQQEWEPKTREDAQRQWKELQNTPDHLGLLKVYKRAGVEPIKLAKSASLPPLKL
jgi:small subunit ribosomal protein S10